MTGYVIVEQSGVSGRDRTSESRYLDFMDGVAKHVGRAWL
jgi:hypothetical protein